ncbi:MAG: gluconokinase, partial [Gemmobacter sp.]|nr:gluconokinase [Gemmobacter sp.]
RLLYLAADQPVIATRLAQRQGHFMPQALLASQYAILEPPGAEESALVVDAGLPSSQIVAEALPHLGRVV